MKDSRRLHFESVVIDAHADTAAVLIDEKKDLRERSPSGHVDLPRLKEGGINVQVFAIYVPSDERDVLQAALHMLENLKEQIQRSRHPDRGDGAESPGPTDGGIRLACSSGDLQDILDRQDTAAVISLEGGHIIKNSLDVLKSFYEQGVRAMTLTWNNNNDWADGCGARQQIPNHGGLTAFGREVIAEMNRLGMLIDVAHGTEETVEQALETSTMPVIVSHTCMHNLNPMSRNLKDRHVRAVADKGGVIGINFFPSFLDVGFRKASHAAQGKLEKESRRLREAFPEGGDMYNGLIRDLEKRVFSAIPPITYHRILDHIDHAVRVAGVDHVGLGSDFDGVPCLPLGMEDCARLPKLTAGLVERGYGEEDIKKIIGGNFLRVFKEVF